MLTRALAQNLVAIGMADLILRTSKVADECEKHHKQMHGCCQEQLIDTYLQVLTNLGYDIYDGE